MRKLTFDRRKIEFCLLFLYLTSTTIIKNIFVIADDTNTQKVNYEEEEQENFGLLSPSSLIASSSSNLNAYTINDNSLINGIGGGGGGGGGGSCERIEVSLCSKMNYNFTRMPNHFKDVNQIDVDVKANLYTELVKSKCSPFIHAYICELLTPVCSNDLTMRKFEIYPCRTFCRQINDDCQEIIIENGKKIRNIPQVDNISIYNLYMTAFNCDLLPYEYNGGNGTNGGPCHEVQPTLSSSSSKRGNNSNKQQSEIDHEIDINNGNGGGGDEIIEEKDNRESYRPYEPEPNNPPYITDTSKIDSSHLKPINHIDATKIINEDRHYNNYINNNRHLLTNDNNRNYLLTQIQIFGQNAYWSLQKYSNILIFSTISILLIALNLERLRKFKDYLSFSPSLSSKSSLSSTSSSTTTTANNIDRSLLNKANLYKNNNNNSGRLISDYPAIGFNSSSNNNNVQMSPSSSLRSLMLIANSNGKQAPRHKLINSNNFCDLETSSIPSQQLLHGLSNQKTMININNHNNLGTLERLKLNNAYNINEKYLLMQRKAQASVGLNKQHFVHHNNNHNHSDKQQLFNTLDSHSSHSNQYDYIQLDNNDNQRSTTTNRLNSNGRQQQQHQLYSNILLSSPSHQVLLFNNNQHNNHHPHPHNNHLQQKDLSIASQSSSNRYTATSLQSPRMQPPPLPSSSRQVTNLFFNNLTSATTSSQLSPYADPNPSSSASSSTIGSRRLG